MKHFYLSLSFLTRIPIPPISRPDPADFGSSALYYPLVGLIIGALLCIPVLLFPHVQPMLLAALLTVLWAILTGGLHLDGIADGADAWLGGLGDEEKTHRILKDPLVGAAGAIAISSILLLKFSALSVLLDQQLWWIILFAPMLGRTAVLLLFLTTPYVRRGGLASAVTDFLPIVPAGFITMISIIFGLVLSWQGILWFLLSFWLLRHLMIKRLRGCTGDTAGASVEISEAFWMIGAAIVL